MSREAQETASRPETGPMQFPDDWPGVFIRGDNAFGYALALDAVLNAAAPSIYVAQVRGLVNLLRSCDAHGNQPPQVQRAAITGGTTSA